jgi:multiple sugar transport system substrate-binding protein
MHFKCLYNKGVAKYNAIFKWEGQAMGKKGFWLTSLVLLLCFSIIGCSAKQASDSGASNNSSTATPGATQSAATDAPSKPIKAQLYFDLPQLANYVKDVNPTLQKSDNVTLEPVPFSDTTSYQTAVRVGFTTQEAPDIFKWWNGFKMKELADSGNLLDMTEHWKGLIENGVSPSLADPLTVDGKIYGIPASAHYWTVFYNKKVFQDNGLSAPTTWDELLKVSDTLKAKGITPFGTTIKDTWNGFIWFEELMAHSNPDFYNKLVIGQAKYTDPEAVEVMKLWKSMYDKGYFYKPLDMNTEIAPAFVKEKIGMYLIGTWYESTLVGAGLKPEQDFGSFILPAVKPEAGKVVISEVTPFLVSQNAKNKEDAVKAILAMTKKEANEKLLAVFGGVPTRKDVVATDPTIKILVDTITKENYKVVTRYWEATPAELSEYSSSEFIRFMLKPDAYMEVLDNIQKKADKYWAEHK